MRSFSRPLRDWLWTAGIIAICRGIRLSRIRPSEQDDPRAFIVTPASPGSLGDEAFLATIVSQVVKRGFRPILIARSPRERWNLGHDYETIHLSKHLRAITSFEALKLVRVIRPVDVLLYPGVDVASGAYGPDAVAQTLLVHVAAATGATCALISFSWPEHPTRRARFAIRTLPRETPLVARDPISATRARRDLRRRVAEGADVALLYEPMAAVDPSLTATLALLEQARARQFTVVGMNVASLTLGISPFDDSAGARMAITAMAAAVAEAVDTWTLADAGLIVLIPHDDRGSQSDVRIAQEVFTLAQSDRVVACPFSSASGVRHLVASLDAVVSARLHLVIAAICSRTAVGAVAYQGKFLGLFQQLGLAELCVDADVFTSPDRLVALIRAVLSSKDKARQQFDNSRPILKALAARNLAMVRPVREDVAKSGNLSRTSVGDVSLED